MNNLKGIRWFVALSIISFFTVGNDLMAVPPTPELSAKLNSANGSLPYYLEHIDEIRGKGVCLPEKYLNKQINNGGAQLSSAQAPFRVLALLVEFSDHPDAVAATYFDSLVFGNSGSTVHNYFSEISFGQLDLVTVNLPSSLGWRTAPQTYAYYVNGQNGLGGYPQNAQKMVEDLVDQVDPFVNFAQYDNDGNGFVDVLLVIHSGTGAEFSGDNDDIWSHKWAISPRSKDGVFISSYTAQPEYWTVPGDMTIGVYSHELCHGFGLPDLYDTDQSSFGIGKWCVMAYGCWNGPLSRGGSPAHPCAWSRIEMGFATATNVSSNMNAVAIDDVNQNGTIYRLWTSGNIGPEYFLVENRQRVGYDFYLPNSGLLIWHIDEIKTGNTQEWYPGQAGANHYKVALEQADTLFEMDRHLDQGDAADAYPGTTGNTSFDAVSIPNSNSYTSGQSFVGVQNISPSGAIINADLIVGFAAGIGDETVLPDMYQLAQNYPNPFNPNTTISFTLPVNSNVKLEIYNLKGELTAILADERMSVGTHSVIWDGTDRTGDEVASGIYFYRLLADEEILTKKMVLVR
jgi:immune inhibitor A